MACSPSNKSQNHTLKIISLLISIIIIMACSGSGDDSNDEPASLNTNPVADITIPVDGTIYDEGDHITFSADCNDNEDGTLTGTSIVWTSSKDGHLSYGGSFTDSGLSTGTHVISLVVTDSEEASSGDTVTIAVNPEGNTIPTAEITNPSGQDEFDQGTNITFTGTGNDVEDGALIGNSLVWRSSIDGVFGTGISVTENDLSVGSHTITLTATDSADVFGTDSITVAIISLGNEQPTANITNPPNDSSFEAGNNISFSGTGSDEEDGSLSGSSLVWTSSRDGEIGTGDSIIINNLTKGTHLISLTVTDSAGNVDTDVISVFIGSTAINSIDGFWEATLDLENGNEWKASWTITQSNETVNLVSSCDENYFVGSGNFVDPNFTITVPICGDNLSLVGSYSNNTLTGNYTFFADNGTFDLQKVNQPYCPEQSIQTANITIDGNISDWAGINPIIVDQTGDGNILSGSDIWKLYIAKDSTKVFLRIDLANGTPSDTLYFGISFYKHLFSSADDQFVFININRDTCTVDRRDSDCGGTHEVVALGQLSISGSLIEASVPISDLEPPSDSFVSVWNDISGPSIDSTEDIKLIF